MTSTPRQSPPRVSTKRKREGADYEDVPLPKRSSSPGSPGKQQRTIGPTLPPANLDEIPLEGPEEDDSSSSDDDYGPAPPSATGAKPPQASIGPQKSLSREAGPPAPAKTQRDEWMLVPPSQDDWSSRVDPTKLKNRKFNTGKGAKAPSQAAKGEMGVWTETPEEKRARLEKQVMGIEEPSRSRDPAVQNPRSEAAAAKVKEYAEKSRGATLYDEHKKSTTKEKDDDPSARPFDREKDIGGGRQFNHTQRKEMLNRAADFGSRFTNAEYL